MWAEFQPGVAFSLLRFMQQWIPAFPTSVNPVSSVVKIGLGVANDLQNSHNRDGQRSMRIPFSHSAMICVICAICG